MKKRWWFLLFFLAGCFPQEEEASFVKAHNTLLLNESHQKIPVYWSLVLQDRENDRSFPILMNDYGYFNDTQYDEEALRKLASELALDIDQAMIPAKRGENGELIPGRERTILKEEQLVSQLLSLDAGIPELVLPIEVTKPNVTEEDIIGIDEKVIGEFSTSFNPHVKGRSYNIYLSAEEISNTVLGPGDSFSFNEIVGERTVDRGYKEAMEIVNKEFVVGIGGGICQTSTTLFNAVDGAGVEMNERYSHSRDVGYVREGLDATVSWNGPDFRFTNPHPYPILIRSQVDLEKGQIHITVHTHNRET